jgi:hypothetical protein
VCDIAENHEVSGLNLLVICISAAGVNPSEKGPFRGQSKLPRNEELSAFVHEGKNAQSNRLRFLIDVSVCLHLSAPGLRRWREKARLRVFGFKVPYEAAATPPRQLDPPFYLNSAAMLRWQTYYIVDW